MNFNLRHKNAHSSSELDRLRAVIRGHGAMVVAFSGGVDSGLLAFVAHEVLGDRMSCALGVSPSLAMREETDAIAFLERYGIPYRLVRTEEIEDERYRANSPDRCFFCKEALFGGIDALFAPDEFPLVAYGANTDDRGDHRPGARSARDRGVVAPLDEAGFDKRTVRAVARELGLELWDKPAAPCLASRIPYDSEVTREKLRQIDRAEWVLKARGFRECRVRHFGDVARVELPAEHHVRAGEMWPAIVNEIREAGFNRVELITDGLRSGRLNDGVGGTGGSA